MLFFLLINVEMPTIVGILTFMTRKIIMLRAEYGKFFKTFEPGICSQNAQKCKQKETYFSLCVERVWKTKGL